MTTRTDKLIQSISLIWMTVLMLTAIGILSVTVATVVHGWHLSVAPFEAVKEQLAVLQA